MHLAVTFASSIEQIPIETWRALAKNADPFLSYEFLHALESSGSIGKQSGWEPYYCMVHHEDTLIALLPTYKKSHSYGEYVFDHAWANAYHQYGLPYYPKLVCAIPYTPVAGTRILLASDAQETMLPVITHALLEALGAEELSSLHWLFVDSDTSNTLVQSEQMQRLSVQFHWYNRDYTDFAQFLQSFNARKRKNVNKERQKVAKSGFEMSRLCAHNISPDDMQFFYQCYCQTYLKRSGHAGYLSQEFFITLLNTMPENLMLVVAKKEGERVAAALFIFDNEALYGRYWGTLEDADGLHFEACYYQGIEFCIEKKIKVFNPGTQGEHKIARGFTPTLCYSNHYLKRPEFQHAIADFLKRETPYIHDYKLQAETLLPFKKDEK